MKRAKRTKLALYLLTISGVIFRSEIAVLVATFSLSFIANKVSLRNVILPTGIFAALVALLVSVPIDSFFWQKNFSVPLWPEWVAFRFNTLDGKSSDWGTSPWHYYFTNSLPKLMLNPMSILVCIPVALAQNATRKFSVDLLLPLLAYVAILSLLPHKEWRFIIYVIPGFTAIAAAGAASIWRRRTNSTARAILCLLLVISTILSFATSMGILSISRLNYPGAHALMRLHEIADGSQSMISVHLDNLACQTGVTRFLEKPSSPKMMSYEMDKTVWLYDKSEEPTDHTRADFYRRHLYVIAEDEKKLPGPWERVGLISAYAGIGIVGAEYQIPWVDSEQSIARVIEWVRSRLLGGRWLIIVMEPRLGIFRRPDTFRGVTI